jgi:GWxTD domain-containing protein
VRASPGYAVLLAALVSGFALPSPAQPPARFSAQAGFSLHAHAFLDPDHRPAVLVSLDIPYSSLIFLKRDGVFRSDYAVYFKVLDKKKKIVETAVVNESVVSKDYEATRSARMTSKVSKRFQLPQGEYIVECTVEVKDTQRVFNRQTVVTVPEFLETGIGVGNPRLYAVDVDTSRFVPALLEVDGHRGFEGTELETPLFVAMNKHLVVTFDVYAEEEKTDSMACELCFEVIDEKKDVHAYGRARATIAGLRNQFACYLDVDEWELGSYTFVAKAVESETVRETTSSITFVLAYTKAMLTKQFDKTIAILSLIATNEEIEQLKSAAQADRPRLWEEFWARRDPSPGTEENEALEEHLRRVRYSIDNFSDAVAGWESDRGKVYIKYGEPDHTELKTDPQSQGEYLIWYYYAENLRFVFYDRFGLGDYRLTGTGQP